MSTNKGLASRSLHSATEKIHSTKEAVVKKSTPTVQKYIVGPAVYSKERLEIGSPMVVRFVKSEMSFARFYVSLVMVLVVLARMTVSDLSYNVAQDNVIMTKFKVHPPTLRSALLTGMGVGLISILLTLVVPPAFGYARAHALGPRCSDKKLEGPTSDLGSNTDDRSASSPSFSKIPVFEAYPKQSSTMSTGGGVGRNSKQGLTGTTAATTTAAAGAPDAAVAAAKKEN
ncbi:MAG: hypothetical protein J3R72DRAFT_423623 [Linnemannia gamsii]|nr:MAG: hypothetical protein J3R72DRAFT_423623 [Linnemannia gamsii]